MRSIQREADDFISRITQEGASLERVSAAAFSKARKKLSPDIFTHASHRVLEVFYQNAAFKRDWKGYRLLAADGSTAEVPNSEEVQKEWAVFKTREDGKKICMSRLSMLYDVLNHTTVEAEIDSIHIGESELLYRHLKNETLSSKDILLLDRYYPSHLLIFYLHHLGINYGMRMKERWWKIADSFYKSGAESGLYSIKLPQKDWQEAAKLGIKATEIQVRLVKVVLDNGSNEVLLSSLLDEDAFSVEDHKELYGMRWGVEPQYRVMKHKVCLENFSGKSLLSIRQDFHAKICILNLTAVLVHPIDTALKEEPRKKHIHQVNITSALGKIKWLSVDLLILKKGYEAIKNFLTWCYNTTEPIRKGRKFKRHKLPKRRFHTNYKPV